jgi:hypothetical protein
MNTETLHPVTDHLAELFSSLGLSEGFKDVPYFDTAKPYRKATIGYGFNIEDSGNLLLVLREMGIINGSMTTSQINTIRNAFTTAINKTPDGQNTALEYNLNLVSRQYIGRDFSINTTQGYNIFREIILGLNDGNINIGGKQQRLDGYLDGSLAHDSKEYVAVMSLFYNAEALVGPSTRLAHAIINDARTEAWYEIRYHTNGDKQQANRRYRESDMFGLWDNGGPTSVELEDFETFLNTMDPYKTSISHLQFMRNYEADYSPKTSAAHSDRIDETINSAVVKNYLVSKYSPGQTIDGNVILGTELNNQVIASSRTLTKSEIKAGYLESTSLNDLILGDKGKDIINGGAGDDEGRKGRP